jgi:hypothetical protein
MGLSKRRPTSLPFSPRDPGIQRFSDPLDCPPNERSPNPWVGKMKEAILPERGEICTHYFQIASLGVKSVCPP